MLGTVVLAGTPMPPTNPSTHPVLTLFRGCLFVHLSPTLGSELRDSVYPVSVSPAPEQGQAHSKSLGKFC